MSPSDDASNEKKLSDSPKATDSNERKRSIHTTTPSFHHTKNLSRISASATSDSSQASRSQTSGTTNPHTTDPTTTTASDPPSPKGKSTLKREPPTTNINKIIPKCKIHRSLVAQKNLVQIAIRRKANKSSEQLSSYSQHDNEEDDDTFPFDDESSIGASNDVELNSKLHIKSLEAGLRVRLTLAPTLVDLYQSITSQANRQLVIHSLNYDDASRQSVSKPEETYQESIISSPTVETTKKKPVEGGGKKSRASKLKRLDSKLVQMNNKNVNDELADDESSLNSVMKEEEASQIPPQDQKSRQELSDDYHSRHHHVHGPNHPIHERRPSKSGKDNDKNPKPNLVPQYSHLPTAIHDLFGISEFTLVRVTRSAATDFEGSVLLKLETAKPGDFKLLDDHHFYSEMIQCIGSKGDVPNNLFLKKIIARPRYKSDMKIYFLPHNIEASLYVDARMFERDLINGVVDIDVPVTRSVYSSFNLDSLLSDFRGLLKTSNEISQRRSSSSQQPSPLPTPAPPSRSFPPPVKPVNRETLLDKHMVTGAPLPLRLNPGYKDMPVLPPYQYQQNAQYVQSPSRDPSFTQRPSLPPLSFQFPAADNSTSNTAGGIESGKFSSPNYKSFEMAAPSSRFRMATTGRKSVPPPTTPYNQYAGDSINLRHPLSAPHLASAGGGTDAGIDTGSNDTATGSTVYIASSPAISPSCVTPNRSYFKQIDSTVPLAPQTDNASARLVKEDEWRTARPEILPDAIPYTLTNPNFNDSQTEGQKAFSLPMASLATQSTKKASSLPSLSHFMSSATHQMLAPPDFASWATSVQRHSSGSQEPSSAALNASESVDSSSQYQMGDEGASNPGEASQSSRPVTLLPPGSILDYINNQRNIERGQDESS